TSAPCSTLVSLSPPRFVFPFLCKCCILYLYRASSLMLLKKGNATLKVSFVS
ncbi:uncharacterized protein K441DRAFT_650334, partial [Cenococcum geophilum 1.58]|uniref:uncharacterized protein n=1 Tax=Cenococcum geophilum 1.58 TaxID=794803 RepID=UPI00358FC719